MPKFTPNNDYTEMLLLHGVLSKKEETRNSDQYKQLQKKLLTVELEMSAKEIIYHTKNAFPFTQEM